MKKEARRRKKERNKEEKPSDSPSDLGEFGTEYEFFMTEVTKGKETALNGPGGAVGRPEKPEDQSKTFFLPDFFPSDD